MNDYHHTILSIPLLRQTEAGDLSHNEWTHLSLLLQQMCWPPSSRCWLVPSPSPCPRCCLACPPRLFTSPPSPPCWSCPSPPPPPRSQSRPRCAASRRSLYSARTWQRKKYHVLVFKYREKQYLERGLPRSRSISFWETREPMVGRPGLITWKEKWGQFLWKEWKTKSETGHSSPIVWLSGEPSNGIFGKTLDSDPTKGGAVNPKFLSICFQN